QGEEPDDEHLREGRDHRGVGDEDQVHRDERARDPKREERALDEVADRGDRRTPYVRTRETRVMSNTSVLSTTSRLYIASYTPFAMSTVWTSNDLSLTFSQ